MILGCWFCFACLDNEVLVLDIGFSVLGCLLMLRFSVWVSHYFVFVI